MTSRENALSSNLTAFGPWIKFVWIKYEDSAPYKLGLQLISIGTESEFFMLQHSVLGATIVQIGRR